MNSTIQIGNSRSWILVALIAIATTGAVIFFLDRAMAQTNDTASTIPTGQEAELRERLTKEQYYVTKQNGTEAPFRNEYWDHHRAGIYVDVISGEALFSSLDKFDSGTGWPSFTRPLVKENVVEKSDATHGMIRIEVRSKAGDAHLGHLFDDGPRDRGGLRYCINSAALRFVPVERLQEEGYGQFLALFASSK